MKICPFDCTPCADLSCLRDGCKQISDTIHLGETVHLICDGCGEPVRCVNCVHLCVACVHLADKTLIEND